MITPPVAGRTRQTRLRVDPALIRAVLDHYREHGSLTKTAAAFGVSRRSVARWNGWAKQVPGWPTEADIAEWAADDAARAADRVRWRAHAEQYRRHAYLRRPALMVPALRGQRQLRALQALGWLQREIGAQMGCSGAWVGNLSGGRHAVMLRVTAEQIDAVYDRLAMRVPPHDPMHDRQRRLAAKKGWAKPLEWDEETIGDPKARPSKGYRRGPVGIDHAAVWRLVDGGERVKHLTHGEAALAYRLLRERGFSTHEIEHRYRLKSERYGQEAS
ncbi:MAG TPA: hypothetical protein VFV01_47875 [Spirillospora sp.]|nr:hypothetical protein [Spirillospora sp.]